MNNVRFAKFDPANGRILFVGEVPESMLDLQGDHVIACDADPAGQYIADGAVVDRPSMGVTVPTTGTADGTTETIIAAVPAGAHVRVLGPASMDGVTDAAGDVTLTFALAGDYTVSIECFPFADVSGVIHAI